MVLVKDGKREPGHLDMQKLDEFCHMLPEVKEPLEFLSDPNDESKSHVEDEISFV